ncbi:MAG: SagB/ThcOx family dehydrogenase [Candidatus Krumholzibacteriia bacterium]
MKRAFSILMMIALAVCFAFPVFAEAQKTIQLPAPQMDGGMPLMKALNLRCTTREYSGEALPPQELSNLLWAACGINRPEKGLRTAPTARNMQEIDVYAALVDGLYLYDAKGNALNLVIAQDLREATGKQPFVKDAPVNLVFVADYAKMGDGSKEMKDFYSATDTGYISQNVYLYCASAGLGTVVRGHLDREVLAKAMNLRADQKVVLAQTVGYPKK